MADLRGPSLRYTLELVYSCIDDLQNFSLETPLNDLDDYEKRWQLQEFCAPLIEAVKHPTQHWQELDKQFSKLLPTTIRQHPSMASLQQIPYERSPVSQAKSLLTRLPRVPQRLLALPLNKLRLVSEKGNIWAPKYLVPEAPPMRIRSPENSASVLQFIIEMQDMAWDNMYVTSFIDTNNVIFLLKIASLEHKPDLQFACGLLRYVNLLAELIDEYESLVDLASFGRDEPFQDPAPSVQRLRSVLFPEVKDDHEQSLSVLKAFLWSAWQRSIMLYFYYVIGIQLWQGSSPTWSSLLAVKGVRRLIELTAEDYRGNGTPYLCNWAFELLRTSRTSLALDFRRLITLFDQHFHNVGGRCIKGSDMTCKGDLPESCQRFTGSEGKSQSLHSTTCNGNCGRVQWSENSYRKCANPRAVVAKTDDKLLHYCKASSNTMAISHVWSHGQGGRPEDGVNVCLHQRYCHLANSFGCDSYWIDSCSIPDDLQLRKEAIMSINDIFSGSGVTLISDKDLQSKDISSGSMEDLEILLSILLVCDWGVRAWTMLEAIRGNKAIHILGHNDKAIRLTDMLRKIHGEGSIDLAVLLGSAQHLLPSSNASSSKALEETGHLLSQRHASRKNDEIIIWGLLSNLTAPKDVVQLWEAHGKVHGKVNTAFLISSAPRIQSHPSLGWAPETPYIRPQHRRVSMEIDRQQEYNVRYPSYDGRESYAASITPQGLWSKWLVHDLDRELIRKLCDECDEVMMATEWDDPEEEGSLPVPRFDTNSHVFERTDYANACKSMARLSSEPRVRLRIIRPLDKEGAAPYAANNARGEDFDNLIAVCVCTESESTQDPPMDVTTKDRDEWHWKGVYEWMDDSHPDWKVEEMLIV